MADKNWTQAQRKAINARGTNLLVSAGAGSGKTAVMIERICTLLEEGAEIKEMLVCTFTKAAAADMKRKLTEEINKRLRERKNERLRKQLHDLSNADIGTLHSWCAHLIKAWFFDADVEPEFTVLEEGEEFALKSEAADGAIQACLLSGDAAFAELYEVFLQNRKHTKLKEAALKVYEYGRARADFYDWLHRTDVRPDEEYRDELYRALEREQNRARGLCEALRADMFTPADLPTYVDLAESVQRNIACKTSVTASKKVNVEAHERLKEAKAAWNAVMRKRAEIDELPSPAGTIPYVKAFAALVQKTDELYAQAKKARGKLDYGDLEHFALRILCGDRTDGVPPLTEHGEEIAAGYKYVFVDEYQDINPLQERILQCFTHSRMFYVGDVKQSIYGFRMCSPRYFLQKAKQYASGGGATVELNVNFRSGSAVLDTVNDVFASIMRADFGGVDYANAPLHMGKKGVEGGVRARIVRIPPKEEALVAGVYSAAGDRETAYDDALQAETDAVTEEIVSLLGDTVPDENGGYRKAKFDDIAVLVWSRTEFIPLLEEKLRKLRIPVTTVSNDTRADGFVSVAMLLNFLRLCDNARDDVALLSAMVSPVFGAFTVEEAASIRKDGYGEGEKPLFCDAVKNYSDNGKDIALRKKTTKFLSALAAWRRAAAVYTVSDLAGKLTAHYGCFAYALSVGGEREASALDAFLAHLAANENKTLHAYLRYIASCGVPRLGVTDGGGAVRIMTVHASKGLEFPCVVLPGLHRQFNLKDARTPVLCDENEGIVLKNYDFAARTVSNNLRYAACARKISRETAAERMRLLYVAMTRAQYKLCLVANEREKKDNDGRETGETDAQEGKKYFDWLYAFMAELDTGAPPQADEEVVSSAQTECDEAVAQRLCERLRDDAERTAETEREAVKVTVTALAHDGQEDGGAPPVPRDGDRATARGTAYHAFMEWAQWDRAGEYDRLSGRFPQAADMVDRAEIEDAFTIVSAYVGKDRCVREQPYVLYDEQNKRLVQGVIDLLIFRDGGAVEIVDYKTGQEKNMYSAAYKKQLEEYKKAAQMLLGVTVQDAKLYAFSARKFISLTEIGKKMG